MPRRRRAGFRFEPPPLRSSAALERILALAFGPPDSQVNERAPCAGGFELASRLGLAPRIAARHRQDLLALEWGEGEARRFSSARAAVVALELAEEAALADFGAVAAAAGVPFALLKGKALVHSGRCPAGGRPGSDLDLLVPERAVVGLQLALKRAGFSPAGGSAWEHQAAVLRHPLGACLELHRMVLGVRLDGRRSARYHDLVRADLLAPWPGATAPTGEAHLPVAELLAAHALVHALAQHGHAPGYPGFWLVADLQDLDLAEPRAAQRLAARIGPWIESDVSAEEADAALDLTRDLARGEVGLEGCAERPRRLAEHFVAAALDPEYGVALRGRQLESLLSDRPPWLARLVAVGTALRVPRALDESGAPESSLRYLVRLAWRPADLVARWRRSRAARRTIAAARNSGGGAVPPPSG